MIWEKVLCLLLFLLVPVISFSQEAIKPRPSPLAISSAHYKDTYLKIVYGQPHKRGRAVFGKLVPYGQVWRTGANEATEMTSTNDIIINGNPLKAGTYTLLSIPGRDKWTIIINADIGLWGAYNYNPKMDIIRFDVPVQTLDNVVYEPFTISINQTNDKAEVSLMWDTTKVSFTIQF